MTERIKDHLADLWPLIAMIAVLLLCLGAMAALIVFDTSEEDCRAKGGHMVSDPSVVVNGNGSVGTTTSSVCYSSDGRRLE